MLDIAQLVESELKMRNSPIVKLEILLSVKFLLTGNFLLVVYATSAKSVAVFIFVYSFLCCMVLK